MRTRLAAIAAALGLSLAACAGGTYAARGVEDRSGALETSVLAEPAEFEMVPAEDPASLALAISSRYTSASAVALATPEALGEASEFAAGVSIPVLVLPADASEEQIAAVVAEVQRLGAEVTAPFGLDVPEAVAAVAPAQADAGAFKWPEAAALPVWTALTPDPAAAPWVGQLAASAGGTATAMPADPRASADSIAAAAALTGPVLAVGSGYGSAEDFQWKLATARTGVELPGGGQLVANGKFYVAIYGHPGAPSLGILGEQDMPATIARAQEHANAYAGLVEGPIVPALEIIVTVASGSAGSDGNYSNEFPAADLVPWVEAARDAGLYVVLDLQPGRTDFLTQAKMYEQLLLYPNVGLALDPEWRLGPDQVHLRQIGSVTAAEVNTVTAWLAELTRANSLPQKMFILHSFTVGMVTDIGTLDVSHPELAYTMHVDGQGGQGAKQGTWNRLREYGSIIPYWGWKNFYDEDVPAMLTPGETISNVNPTPLLVTYQ